MIREAGSHRRGPVARTESSPSTGAKEVAELTHAVYGLGDREQLGGGSDDVVVVVDERREYTPTDTSVGDGVSQVATNPAARETATLGPVDRHQRRGTHDPFGNERLAHERAQYLERQTDLRLPEAQTVAWSELCYNDNGAQRRLTPARRRSVII